MTAKRFDSVWDAVSPAEAEHMKLRSHLMIALRDHIAEQSLTQSAAAKQMGVTQPRISDLVRGRIDLFSIDGLVDMASSAGLQVHLEIAKAA